MPLSIYYLDDEEALCENFVDHFASPDVRIRTFVDPKVAIDVIIRTPPHLLFIDHRLPGTTGDEVAQLLDPMLPKFLITGDITVKTEYPFLKVFPKPYAEEDIAEVLDSFVFGKKIG